MFLNLSFKMCWLPRWRILGVRCWGWETLRCMFASIISKVRNTFIFLQQECDIRKGESTASSGIHCGEKQALEDCNFVCVSLQLTHCNLMWNNGIETVCCGKYPPTTDQAAPTKTVTSTILNQYLGKIIIMNCSLTQLQICMNCPHSHFNDLALNQKSIIIHKNTGMWSNTFLHMPTTILQTSFFQYLYKRTASTVSCPPLGGKGII